MLRRRFAEVGRAGKMQATFNDLLDDRSACGGDGVIVLDR